MVGLHATVIEEAYAVVARIEGGEFRSDRLGAGFRLVGLVALRGHEADVVEEDEAISVRIALGDAPENEFERAAWDLMEMTSW